MSTLETQTILTKPTEDRLLTQEEREDAMRSAGQLQRETDQPVSVFAAVCLAQDAKTAKFFQAQVDAAEAAYKDAYAATQLMGQMLEENKTKVTIYETARQQNGKTT